KAAEDAKQNEAKDKDAAHERQVDDYDKVLREYRELKEEHARLQHAKSLADKALIEEKDRHERDTADMKSRNDGALAVLEKNLQSEKQRAESLEVSKNELQKAHDAKMVAMYDAFFRVGSWDYVAHKSGYVLTFVVDGGRPVLKARGHGWQQRFHPCRTRNPRSLQLYCKIPDISSNWFLSMTDGKLVLESGAMKALDLEIVPGEKGWFYLKSGEMYLGTEGGSMGAAATIIAHTNPPGPADLWQLDRYDFNWPNILRLRILHKFLKGSGKPILLEHKSGLVLDCHRGELRPILAGKHGNWNQRFEFDMTQGFTGFEVVCKDQSGNNTWLAPNGASPDRLLFSSAFVARWIIEPIGADTDYFYLSDGAGLVLGTRDGSNESQAEVIRKPPTDSDQWKFVYA
ncbi:hypothetical protein OC846_006847, partial [Tilletia horrida]